jgi:hypothetical protein
MLISVEQFLQDLEHLHYTKSTLILPLLQFIGGVPFEVGTSIMIHQIIRIPQLKQEESQSASIGFKNP